MSVESSVSYLGDRQCQGRHPVGLSCVCRVRIVDVSDPVPFVCHCGDQSSRGEQGVREIKPKERRQASRHLQSKVICIYTLTCRGFFVESLVTVSVRSITEVWFIASGMEHTSSGTMKKRRRKRRRRSKKSPIFGVPLL